MSRKSIVLIVVFFSLLVVGMFVYAYLKNNEIQRSEPVDNSFAAGSSD